MARCSAAPTAPSRNRWRDSRIASEVGLASWKVAPPNVFQTEVRLSRTRWLRLLVEFNGFVDRSYVSQLPAPAGQVSGFGGRRVISMFGGFFRRWFGTSPEDR